MEIPVPAAGAQSCATGAIRKYVCNALKLGWAAKWRSNGWKRSKSEPALNPDLWEELLQLYEKHDVNVIWVKGHAGHPENERCDELAVAAAQRVSAN